MEDASGERLVVDATCSIDLNEIEWSFGPSGGPGGQHANRAHTRAEARFDVAASPSLTAEQRQRLLAKLGPLVAVSADDTRSQTRNRALALDRLRDRVAAALVVPRPRRPTRPSKAAVSRRLDEKKRRGDTKAQRRRPPRGDD